MYIERTIDTLLMEWKHSSSLKPLLLRGARQVGKLCKAGTSGKMKSLHLFMRQKHLTDGVRCSLENFALLENQDKQDENVVRRIRIVPLYAVSNLYAATSLPLI